MRRAPGIAGLLQADGGNARGRAIERDADNGIGRHELLGPRAEEHTLRILREFDGVSVQEANLSDLGRKGG